MGVSTGIAWTRSTRNFWSGCTKVGPGCDGCYAEATSRRMRGVNEATGQSKNWGVGAPRVPHLANADRDVRKWDKLCGHERTKLHRGKVEGDWPYPGFWPVFINSYSDTFDNEVPQDWRRALFTTIEDCEKLTFQLVTKRLTNVRSMLEGRWSQGKMPKNVWLLITVVDQAELDRDGPRLLELTEDLGFPVVGLSIEPQIGPVDARAFLALANEIEQPVWGISGGESSQAGHPARPFDIRWGLDLANTFADFRQPFFFKQTGSAALLDGVPYPVKGKGDDPAEWPVELNVRQFPRAPHVG